MGLGHITSLDGNKECKVDIVPTDFASHLLLILATRDSSSRAEVINLSTSTRNYITLQQLVDHSR